MRGAARVALGVVIVGAVAIAPVSYAATSVVQPATETVDRQPSGTNDADDPSFWVHPSDPAKSLVITTVKQAGIDVFRPDGTLVQTVPIPSTSRFNNVEVVYNISVGGVPRDLALVSDRGTDKVHVFRIDGSAAAPLTEVTAAGVPLVFGGAKKVRSKTTYGLTAWRNPDTGVGEVFVTQENSTTIAKLALTDAGSGKVGYQKVASINLPSTFALPNGTSWKPCFNPSHPDWLPHAEGMVVDPANGTLWVDQEIVGLWKMTTDLTDQQLVRKLTRFGQRYTIVNQKCKVDAASQSFGEPYLPGDLEGIGLYRPSTSADSGYLVISNQQKSLFTVFTRRTADYVGTFTIGSALGIDPVQQTDGVDVINVSIGGQYAQGMLVTQDGSNAPEGGTNFKFTPWPNVAGALGLVVDTAGSPRG